MTSRRRGLPLSLALVLLLTSLLGSVGRAAAAPLPPAPGGPHDPQVRFVATTQRDAAVEALGADLPRVAEAYGLTPDRLRSLLLEDGALALDQSGRLFYACAAAPASSLQRAPALMTPRTSAVVDVFRLHSLRGAPRVIYLDFTGGTLQGCVWNERTGRELIRCPSWNITGSPTTFSLVERAIIRNIWRRVAEDYAPFAVDVTTEEPPADRLTRSSDADELYGTRVLVSPASAHFGRVGGVAYVGVYDVIDEGDYYEPALVFPENLANNEKTIAEAVAHEVGHTLGLSHDGVMNGPTYYMGLGRPASGWAPIMGAGYAKALSQWSKGEYAHASNREDDLMVMRGHGLPGRADDHGDTASTATVLSGATLSARGVVETPADVDVLAFRAGAGRAKFSLKPAVRGPNLDIRVDLLAGDGRTVAIANPSKTLAAGLSVRLPAEGTYYLLVRGVGRGNPLTGGYSDYGSLGAYRVSGTVAPPSASEGV